jgi:hypothetical protein
VKRSYSDWHNNCGQNWRCLLVWDSGNEGSTSLTLVYRRLAKHSFDNQMTTRFASKPRISESNVLWELMEQEHVDEVMRWV